MVEEADLSTFDLRYEGYRMRNPAQEARLLASITERGIEEALEGVDVEGRRILLNGFKRYRCARKLSLWTVPYASLGDDTAAGIIAVLRASNHRSLSILEEARFIEDLRSLHRLSVAAIAETLSRSKAWVSMRLGLLAEMGERIREKIFSGAFPVYSYMYTLRPFIRMNGTERQEVEAFTGAVAGKKLSVREIEQLAHGYFRGPEWFRREGEAGNLALVLERVKRVPDAPDGTNAFERVLLGDLEIVGKYMRKTTAKSQDPRIQTRAFCAQANLLLSGILSRLGAFAQTMRSLHDRTAKA
ncbi:MAG: chromosome partitioning protein ParB [Planctomycetes bacterium]|nr:chromosome partitioning protein ParB [Planctomycetota bacterium]